jgi:hypothetical protein
MMFDLLFHIPEHQTCDLQSTVKESSLNLESTKWHTEIQLKYKLILKYFRSHIALNYRKTLECLQI